MAASRFIFLRAPGESQANVAPDAMTRREQYFFELYRVFEGTLLVGFCFSPLAENAIAFVSPLVARGIAIFYLIAAVALMLAGRRFARQSVTLVFVGLTIDILTATGVLVAVRGLDTGTATLLLVNLSCGALLLPARLAFGLAALAAISVTLTMPQGAAASDWGGNLMEGALFGASYLAATMLLQVLRSHVSRTQELVEQQEYALGNLTQLNELIIRRMRTGVIVVDGANQIHQINEAAWSLVGSPPAQQRDLSTIAPELTRRLYHWRTANRAESMPVALAEGMPEVIPRFVRMGAGEDHAIVFLDDTSLLSRQAEQLTLTSLGRLSASIAHEIRNPLAAISYSVQLLAESEEIPEPDMRLVDIIRAQCQRVNSIVENILQLSRRERSRPEPLDLGQWVLNFVEEYKSTNPLEQDEVRAAIPQRKVVALADAGQLQQIIWNLVQNARRYGRLPDEPARVTVVARGLAENGSPVVEVVDRGPGIPKKVADQVFDPFFTTHEHGTGLGLYIARQLCEANQGSLEYVPVAGGGSCFRIVLPAPAPVALRPTTVGGRYRSTKPTA
jgi:two-component system, NtrC family, sensor histidine kinase PilS